MAKYLNNSSREIELSIGTHPGCPPDVYRAGPGECVEGPAGYERRFVRGGFTRVGDDWVRPKSEKTEEKPRAKPKAKAKSRTRVRRTKNKADE